MNNVEYYKVLSKQKKLKQFKQNIRKRIQDKIIILRDTRGTETFALKIGMPAKDYKTNISLKSEPLSKQERLRINSRKWKKNNPDKYKEHLEYVKEWKRNNKERKKQVQQDWYQRNRPWLLEYYKNFYHQNRDKILEEQRQKRKEKKKSVNKSTKTDTKGVKTRRKVTL